MKENDKKSVKKVDTKKSSAVPLADDKLKSVSAGQQHVDQPSPIDVPLYEYEKPTYDFGHEHKEPDLSELLK